MLVCTALACAHVAAAAPAPRLVYTGTALSRPQVEGSAAPTLRAPRDSVALASLRVALTARLEDLGYLEAWVGAHWDSAVAPPVLIVACREGERFRWSAVVVRAGDAADSARVAGPLALRVGDWASPGVAARAIQRALDAAVDAGYPYAEVGVSGWQADSGRVRLEVSGRLGPRVTISRARVDGLKVTRPAVVARAMGRLAGRPYDRAAAAEARDRLVQLGLFQSVAIDGLEGEGGDWSRAQLVYRVEEPRYNRFEGVVGVQGAAGTVGLARLDLGNLAGTGRTLGLAWESRGRGVTSFAARYAEPLVFGTPIRVEGAIEQQLQDSLYARTRWGARARFSPDGQQRIEAGYDEERVVQEHDPVREADLQTTVFAFERGTLDAPLAPRRGWRGRATASETFKTELLRPEGRRTARASAAELHLEWHRPLRGASGVALELTGAGRFSSQRVLPVFERYPVGGAASLRGWDEEAFRADRYALSRLEWRWFLGAAGAGAQRVFLFWDHAAMQSRVAVPEGGDQVERLQRDGVGFGLRLEAAGGLIGLDYGLAPGRPPLEGKIHLQLISTF